MSSFSRLYWTWIIGSGIGLLLCGNAIRLMIQMFALMAYSERSLAPSEFTADMPQVAVSIVCGSILAVIGFIAWCKLFYRAWNLIFGQYTTTPPAMAIVLFFVPLFNIYWMFTALFGLATGLNNVALNRGIPAPRVPAVLGIITCVLGLLTVLLAGMNVSPYAYLATSLAATVSNLIFFYCMQRAAGRIAAA